MSFGVKESSFGQSNLYVPKGHPVWNCPEVNQNRENGPWEKDKVELETNWKYLCFGR